MAVSNSWHLLRTHITIFWLPEFVSDGSVVNVLFLHYTNSHMTCGVTLGLASPSHPCWRLGALVKENYVDPLDSIPPSVWVMQCEGNKFVLVAVKADVILSHPLFARYRPVPFITLPTSSRSWIAQVAGHVSPSQEKNGWWITSVGERVVSLAFSESREFSNIALERSE